MLLLLWSSAWQLWSSESIVYFTAWKQWHGYTSSRRELWQRYRFFHLWLLNESHRQWRNKGRISLSPRHWARAAAGQVHSRGRSKDTVQSSSRGGNASVSILNASTLLLDHLFRRWASNKAITEKFMVTSFKFKSSAPRSRELAPPCLHCVTSSYSFLANQNLPKTNITDTKGIKYENTASGVYHANC